MSVTVLSRRKTLSPNRGSGQGVDRTVLDGFMVADARSLAEVSRVSGNGKER